MIGRALKLRGIFSKRILFYSGALILLLGGLAYLHGPRVYYSSLNAEEMPTVNKKVSPDLRHPIKLKIERLRIEVPIKSGRYDPATRTWTLNYTDAFYARNSETPLIYGHRTGNVFQKLEYLKNNDALIITTKQGNKFVFQYKNSRNLSPHSSEILSETIPNNVILMTCSGLWNEERKAHFFEYLGESPHRG